MLTIAFFIYFKKSLLPQQKEVSQGGYVRSEVSSRDDDAGSSPVRIDYDLLIKDIYGREEQGRSQATLIHTSKYADIIPLFDTT